MRVALYTTGIGGGHLARAVAVQRGLARARAPVDFRIFYADPPAKLPAGVSVVPLTTSRAELADVARAKQSPVARALASYAPDLLLVDLAWFDLRNVLPLPGTEVWLLLRWCPPEFLRGPLNREFEPSRFARIIGIEPIAPAEARERIEPIVIANPDECLTVSEVREHFGAKPGTPLSLVVQAGLPGECEELLRYERERAPEHHVVATSLHGDEPLFPVAPYLPGADRIVGGAGYNLFWETRWLGVEDRTEHHVFRRRIDDQTPRLRAPRHVMRENGADALARLILLGSW